MVYQYDLAIQLPVKDLYDTQIMQMAITAARDMYEKGEKQIKEILDKYGDFYSPIPGATEMVYNEGVGRVQNEVNKLYEQGIDPLRTVEGRAKIAQIIRNIDVAKINSAKMQAELAKEYIKNRDKARAEGTYSEALERSTLGGKLLEEWTPEDGPWMKTSPTAYKDLNQWTSHLFDDMEQTYNEELSGKGIHKGYDVYTKDRATKSKILDTHLDGLLSSDLGQYYLNSIKNNLPAGTVDKDAKAREILKERILDATGENEIVKRVKNDYDFAKFENKLDIDKIWAQQAAKDYYDSDSDGSKTKNDGPKLSYNYQTGLLSRGITYPFRYNPQTGVEEAANNMMANQIRFGQEVGEQFKGDADRTRLNNNYVSKFTIYEAVNNFGPSISRQADHTDGSVWLSIADKNRLRSTGELVSTTYGYPFGMVKTNKKRIPDPIVKTVEPTGEVQSNLMMIPYEDVYTAYNKETGRIEQSWKVRIVDNNGNSYGDWWYTLPTDRESNSEVPRIDEWYRNPETGLYWLPKDNKGRRRDLVKLGLNPKSAGAAESSKIQSNKANGVSSMDFKGNTAPNYESIEVPLFNSK